MLGIDISTKYIGLQEVRDNKQLKSLLKSQSVKGDIAIDPAKVSWCAAWVNFCERECGRKGNGKLTAQSFRTYGTKVKLKDIQRGDIVIFHFPGQEEWQGHIGFYDHSNRDGTISVLGGNQSNMVCYTNYIPDYIMDIRRAV